MELIDNSKVESKEEKAKRRKERELSDARFILKYVEGRRFCKALLEDCGVFKDTFYGDVNSHLVNTGRRQIGLNLWHLLLEAKPESFFQMIQEFQAEKKSDENLDKDDNKPSDLI